MSAVPHDFRTGTGLDEDLGDESITVATPVVVRRNAGLAALIGAGASAIAIAYLWRATQTGGLVDWALCLVLALIGVFYLASLLDSRTPLVIADDLGVRVRLGAEWRGLPWDAISQVVVQPARGPLRDGRLSFSPRSLGRALDGLDPRGRRQARMNQKLYGAALAVPLGLTTRLSTKGSVAEGIAALALGRAHVVIAEPRPVEERRDKTAPRKAQTPSPAAEADVRPDDAPQDWWPDAPAAEDVGVLDADLPYAPDAGAALPRPAHEGLVEDSDEDQAVSEDTADGRRGPAGRGKRLGRVGGFGSTIVSRVAKRRSTRVGASPVADPETGSQQDSSTLAPETSTIPLRSARPALRAQITRDTPSAMSGRTAAAPQEDPAGSDRPVNRPTSSRVRPIFELGDPVEALVIDDFVVEPAYDPVIGPQLAAARNRVGLSVDELADRTRIRPHVIESIEVDDFTPCGGDFYARGHLRTLARVLGQESEPMLATFEQRYATAPVNARRVFEAELATGMRGSVRGSLGGPNWGLMIGAVILLVLVWGIVRLFATQPVQNFHTPAPVLNGSAGIDHTFPHRAHLPVVKQPLHITVAATTADSHVVVRDGTGKVIFAGVLAAGTQRTLAAPPPLRVGAANGGVIDVHVAGKDRGPLGAMNTPSRRTFHRPHRPH